MESFWKLSLAIQAFILLIVQYIAYWLVVYIYRVTFHPLARFPGPKLAALTFWYEIYYDVWPNDGRYTWQIQKLHEKYGPVVRINPKQLHFHDAAFYEDIYAGASRPREKCSWEHFEQEPNPMSRSVIMTINHDTHRMRRGPLEKFFSKRTIRELEPVLTSRIELYRERLETHHREGTVVNLSDMYAGLTMDIISEYCFGIDPGCSKELDSGKKYRDMLNGATMTALIFRHFHAAKYLANSLPPWLLLKMSPLFKAWHDFMLLIEACVKSVTDSGGKETSERTTIFHDIVNGNLPPAEKDLQRLMDEGVVLIGAGLETTARTLAVLSYFVLADAYVHGRLLEELRAAMPSPTSVPKAVELEKLPYLSACINEAHRLANAVPYRTSRVAPYEELRYGQWTIPRGTSMSQTIYLLHTDPAVFQDPFAFKPQRWIDNPKLTRNLIPFSRGSRACIGLNLAQAELCLTAAMLFRRFRLELHDTNEERDILVKHIYGIGFPDHSSPGIQARVVEVLME